MANAYGIVHQYGEPQSTFDADLAANVLGQKQQQFDANQQKIDQTLAQMGLQASMIKNDDAKKYLSDRVNQVIQETQNLRTSDIGSKDSTRKILSTINTALDDKALKHIGYGQQIEQFQSSVNAAMEEGKYADQNYQDAVQQAGLQEYIQGDVNADLGNLNYNPFVDVNMGLVKKVKDIKASMGEQFEEVINAEGVVEKVKINNLTDAQWQQVLPRYVDDQMKTQIEIEGRARFGWNKENVVRYAEQAIDSKIEPLKKGIEKRKSLLQTDGEYSEFQKKQLKDEIATAQRKIEAFESQKLNQDYDMTTLGGSLVMEDLINTTASIVGNDPSIERDYSEVGKTSNKANAQNALGIGLPSNVKVSNAALTDIQKVSEQERARQRLDVEKDYVSLTNEAIQKIKNPEMKQRVESRAKEIQEEYNLNLKEARAKAYTENAKTINTQEALEYLKRIEEAQIEYNQKVKTDEKAYQNALTQKAWKNNDVYKSFNEKGLTDRTKVVLEDGTEIHSRDYLQSQGIESFEDYQEWIETEDAIDFKSQVTGQNLLSDVNTGVALGISSIGYALDTLDAVNKFDEEDYHNVKSFIASTGEDLDLTDLFVFGKYSWNDVKKEFTQASTPEIGEGKRMAILQGDRYTEEELISHLGDATESMYITLNPEAKDTKAYKTLSKLIETGNYQKLSAISSMAGNLVDTSFYNDKTIREAFSRKNIIDEVNNQRAQQQIDINAPMKLTVDGANTPSNMSREQTELQSLSHSSTTLEGKEGKTGFKFDYKLPTEIMVNTANPNQIIITQNETLSKADFDEGTVQRINDRRTAVVSKEEFDSKMPTLYASLDLSKQAGKLNYMEELEIEKDRIAYPKGENKKTIQTYTDFFGNPESVNGVTRDLTINQLRNSLPIDEIGQESQNAYMEGFKNVINNSDRFKIKYEKTGGRQYINIFDKEDDSGDELFSVDVSDRNPNDIMTTLNVAPQKYLSMYLQAAALDIRNNISENRFGISERFERLWEIAVKQR